MHAKVGVVESASLESVVKRDLSRYHPTMSPHSSLSHSQYFHGRNRYTQSGTQDAGEHHEGIISVARRVGESGNATALGQPFWLNRTVPSYCVDKNEVNRASAFGACGICILLLNCSSGRLCISHGQILDGSRRLCASTTRATCSPHQSACRFVLIQSITLRVPLTAQPPLPRVRNALLCHSPSASTRRTSRWMT